MKGAKLTVYLLIILFLSKPSKSILESMQLGQKSADLFRRIINCEF